MNEPALRRKSLLYRSKVEYGGWTANHALGCKHGCKYPCYAMALAKRTGRIATYEDWLHPRLVENALDLLERELSMRAQNIDSVHLCFTTDPFMFDREADCLVGDVVGMTMGIIRRLNAGGIPVTTLTKGYYPDGLIEGVGDLHPDNQYGISLVSLSEAFRSKWEPGAAPIRKRIEALRALSHSGARTWVSIEPYPTPNIDPSSPDIVQLLDSVAFVDKVVFGKWNYNGLATTFDREHHFYEGIAGQVVQWCRTNAKTLLIKKGTPLAREPKADFLALD